MSNSPTTFRFSGNSIGGYAVTIPGSYHAYFGKIECFQSTHRDIFEFIDKNYPPDWYVLVYPSHEPQYFETLEQAQAYGKLVHNLPIPGETP